VRPALRTFAGLALATVLLSSCASVADQVASGVVSPGAAASAQPTTAPGWEAPTKTPSASPSPGAETSTTPSVSPSAAAAVQASLSASVDAGTTTLVLSASTCDIAAGDWSGTLGVEGATATTPVSFSIPPGKDGTKVSWSLDGSSGGVPTTWKITGDVFEGGTAQSPELLLFGTLDTIQGQDETHTPARATGKVTLGSVAGCA
jgi:hypothetical protein